MSDDDFEGTIYRSKLKIHMYQRKERKEEKKTVMKEKMDKLVARFHSLQGNNLQETKRNFNELIDVIRRDVPLETDLNTLIASIEAKTKLESFLKVEMLVRFERYDALLEILKGGDPKLIGKVLKCWKLFEVVFSRIDSQTLVGQIFPQTSFSTRTKIITRLSTNLRNEELADEYFQAIEDKYGLSVAKGMLPACSLELIKSTVETYKLTLTSRQLLKIVKRNRSFLSYYLCVINQTHGQYFDVSSKYPQVLKYMAQVDEQLFWELFKKYELRSKFGRHMTPRLYESGKRIVTITDYKLNLFNYRKLHKAMGKNDGELRPLLLQLFPNRVNYFVAAHFSSSLKTLIGYFPKHKRYEVLNGCFKEVYGESIHELLRLNTPQDILEFMPVQEREIILDEKVKADENFIYMYSPNKAIPVLKERIQHTSDILKRSNFLVQLNKTCMLSRDSEALLEVLKYVISRHRNADAALVNFMISFQEWPKLEKLTFEHWACINELLKTCKKMKSYELKFSDVYLMMKYFSYLVENNLPCDEFMESFLVYLVEKAGTFSALFDRNLPKWEKISYEYFTRLLPKLYSGDQFEKWSCLLLATIATHNYKYPRNTVAISQYPLLMEAFRSQVKKQNNSNLGIILIYYLKFEYEDTGDQLFWDNYETLCNADMIIWYLQKRPNKMLEHLDKILTPRIIQLLRHKLHKILNLVSMLPIISEKIVSFSLKALHDDDAAVSRFAAISLSYLAGTDEYLEATRPFVPLPEGKINFKRTKKNFVFTQRAVVDGLSNLDDPAACLPVLLKFCVGDYMKHASKSLYHVTNHTPESKLEFFLNSLYNSAVSVRKHAVDITARFSPKSTVHTFLKNSGQHDKHPSLRKAIFKNTLRYFIANPSEEFWSLLKDNVKIIDENDRETMDCLTNLNKIPRKYFSDYFSMVYTTLSNNKDKATQAKKYALLASVRDNLINELSSDCLIPVIKDTFPSDDKRRDFYLKCLFCTTESNNVWILDLIFDILIDYTEKNYSNSKARAVLYDIIYAICVRAVSLKSGKGVIEKFIEFWISKVKQGKLLEEYLLLQLTNAYLDFQSHGNPRKYGGQLSEVLEELVGLHDSSVVCIFTERLNVFLIDFFDFTSDGKKELELFDGFLSANDADFNYIATMILLFRRAYWNEIKARYNSILIKIRDHKSPVVRIYLLRHLRNIVENMDELVERFHSLQGDNLQEVKRSFNDLLDAIQRDASNEADLDSIIASINPKTKLESVLKIEILIRFKRYDALLDVLKSENPMLIGKVLKCWKFFEVVFSKIDAETLVNQIFPHTSFSARMKIITKLSLNLKNEELADSYFHAIEDKYGLFVAKELLPACSLDLIKSTVTSYKVILSSRQLLRIVKRDREFLRCYFDVLHQTYAEDFSRKYSEVLRYVAKFDDRLFWELFKKYQLKVKFGHRMSPKLYENGEEFLTPSDYSQGVFKLRKIYGIVGKSHVDLRKFLLNLYPKKADLFSAEFTGYNLRTFIGYLPKNKKYDILNDCFREAYGKNIHEFPTGYIPDEILRLIPDREREVFVDNKLEQDESFIYMYPTRKSIPLLCERIKYTSNISKRSELAVLLSKTCRFNKDAKGLLEVLKYMRLRHKNDKSILMDFLIDLWRDTKYFNGENWALIYELLKLVMPNFRMFAYGTHLMRKYLHYAVKNNLPCDEFMRTFLKYIKDEGGFFETQFEDVKCERFYYESFAQLLPLMYEGEDFVRLSCNLLASIARFNKRRTKNKITISKHPVLMSAVKTQLSSVHFLNARAVLIYCLKFEYNDIYDRLFWEHFQKTCDADILIWYLQNKPSKVLEHIDDVLMPLPILLLNTQPSKFFRSISLLSFNGISQKVLGFALERVHHEDFTIAKFSVNALPYLAKQEDYFEIIQKFLPPPKGKIDLNTMPQNYVSSQEALIKGLSNFNDPISCLPLLLEFCIGDYMKFALGSLYRIANRIPESKLHDFLDSLHQSVASARKHAVNLTTRLETKERVYNFLKASGEGDKRASLQKITFKSTLRYFSANPSQKLWNLLKNNIKLINKDDQKAFASLVNIRKIPPEYQPEYVQIVYEMLVNNNNKDISAKKYDLLTAVYNNLVNKLDVQFMKRVIEDTVLQPNVPQGNDFYFRSVFHTTGEKQADILNEILGALKTYVERNWTDYAIGETRKNVYDLIRNFCLRAIKMNSNNVAIEKFLQFVTSEVTNGGLLEEYLLLQLTNAYLVCSSEVKQREYGAKVSGILAEWIGLYGPSVIPMFTEVVVNFSKEFLDSYFDDEKQIAFVDGLLQANGDDFNNIFVLNVIFRLVTSSSIKDRFDSVLETLRKTESAVVQLHLHVFLRNFGL